MPSCNVKSCHNATSLNSITPIVSTPPGLLSSATRAPLSAMAWSHVWYWMVGTFFKKVFGDESLRKFSRQQKSCSKFPTAWICDALDFSKVVYMEFILDSGTGCPNNAPYEQIGGQPRTCHADGYNQCNDGFLCKRNTKLWLNVCCQFQPSAKQMIQTNLSSSTLQPARLRPLPAPPSPQDCKSACLSNVRSFCPLLEIQ